MSRLHRRGTDPLSVLVIGDEIVVDGLTQQDAYRLVEQLSDGVAARTGRALDLDAMWDFTPALDAVASGSDAWRLWRYEAVVLLLPATPRPRWRVSRATKITDRVISELASASQVLLVLLQHPAHPAFEVNLEGDTSSIRSVSLPVLPGTPARVTAEHVEYIAEQLTALLQSTGPGPEGMAAAAQRRARPQRESERQQAVDRTVDAMGGLTLDLQRVVLLAKNSFDVPYAQVNLVDRGRIRTLAFAGRSGDGAEQPLCNVTVQTSGATIIPDTWQDSRLATNPHVHGEGAPVRFYAAHPLESEDGYRIGTVCVFDFVPHLADDRDAAVLRDLAQLAEAEISAVLH